MNPPLILVILIGSNKGPEFHEAFYCDEKENNWISEL